MTIQQIVDYLVMNFIRMFLFRFFKTGTLVRIKKYQEITALSFNEWVLNLWSNSIVYFVSTKRCLSLKYLQYFYSNCFIMIKLFLQIYIYISFCLHTCI